MVSHPESIVTLYKFPPSSGKLMLSGATQVLQHDIHHIRDVHHPGVHQPGGL